MRRPLLIACLLLAVSRAALGDSTVPALTAATTLTGSTIYLAQGGALDRKLAFNTGTFGVFSNALIINTTTLGSTALTFGSTTSTIAGLTLTSPTFTTPALGTPASGVLTSTTGYTVANLSGAGTGILTALGVNVGSAGAPVLFNGALGTPSSGTATNLTGLPIAGITGLGTNVGTSLGNTLNASAGPIGALTPTNSNCVVGNGSAWTSAACPGGGTSTVTANSNTETAVTTFAFGTGFNVPGGSSGTAAITLAVVPVTDATASRTLTGTDGGKLIHMTNGAATAITLPDSATVTSKFGTNLVCDAGCTVTRAGSDTVNGGTSIVVAPKAWASIATDGAGVFLLGLSPGAVTGTGSMVQATSPTLVTPTIGVATATSVNKVALTAPGSSATLTIADGKTLTDTSAVGAVALKGATGGGFAAATNNDLPAVSSLSGTTHSLAPPREYWYCTGTCTVTPPVPAAGYEFCVANNIAVTSVITMAALGSSARYPKTDSSAYGTAGTGTMVAGGAAGDKICLVGLDSTHYNLGSYAGTWTVN